MFRYVWIITDLQVPNTVQKLSIICFTQQSIRDHYRVHSTCHWTLSIVRRMQCILLLPTSLTYILPSHLRLCLSNDLFPSSFFRQNVYKILGVPTELMKFQIFCDVTQCYWRVSTNVSRDRSASVFRVQAFQTDLSCDYLGKYLAQRHGVTSLTTLTFSIQVTCLALFILFDLTTRMTFNERYHSWNSLCTILSAHVDTCFPGLRRFKAVQSPNTNRLNEYRFCTDVLQCHSLRELTSLKI